MERRYQGRWDVNMFAYYIWTLKRKVVQKGMGRYRNPCIGPSRIKEQDIHFFEVMSERQPDRVKATWIRNQRPQKRIEIFSSSGRQDLFFVCFTYFFCWNLWLHSYKSKLVGITKFLTLLLTSKELLINDKCFGNDWFRMSLKFFSRKYVGESVIRSFLLISFPR